jgi:hypothetical protein
MRIRAPLQKNALTAALAGQMTQKTAKMSLESEKRRPAGPDA